MLVELTGRGHRVLLLAGEEARRLDHENVGTEHLFLALLADESNAAAQALQHAGVMAERMRAEVLGAALAPASDDELYDVVDLAGQEAQRFGHAFAGPEHLLLGLLRLDGGRVVEVRSRLGVDVPVVEAQLLRLMTEF